MKTRILGIFIFLTAAFATTCWSQGAEASLDADMRVKYQGKRLMLRNFYCGKELQFDVQGNLLSGGPSGPWTLCRDIRVKDIKVENGKFEISGERVYLFHAGHGQFRDITEVAKKNTESYKELLKDQAVSIHGQLPGDADSSAIQSAMDKLFYPSEAEFLASAPDIWKPFFHIQKPANSIGISPLDSRSSATADDSPALSKSKPLHVGNGVSPPVPVYSPDPNYTVSARLSQFQGTTIMTVIIGPDGKVHQAFVTHPLGMGLDEKAIEKILSWTFRPATKDGKLVAVEVTVEVQFNLY